MKKENYYFAEQVESLRLEKTDCADMQFPATLRHRETCKKDGRCPDYGRTDGQT